MKIFENTATTFTSNGLGPLPDATSAGVTEEVNGIFELEFEYPITGLHYAEIKRNRLVVCKPDPYDAEQAFRIYSISKPISGIVKVNARHIAAADLPGIVLKPPTIYPGNLNGSSAVQSFLNTSSNYLNTNRFTFTIEPSSSNYCRVPVPMSAWDLMGGDEYQMLHAFGGEYYFNNFNVTLKTARGVNRGVTLRYGKNITDIKQDENIEGVFTGVYPYYYNDENGRVLGDIQSTGSFNYSKIMLLDCSSVDWYELGYTNGTDSQGNPTYEGAPTRDMLNTYARDYIAREHPEKPEISIDVSFVDLRRAGELDTVAELSRVQLGDTVKVIFPELLDSAVEAECTKIEYNVLTDEYTRITLGDRAKNAADSLAYESKVISAIDQQTDSLTIKLQATDEGLMSEVARAEGTEAELSSRITQTATAITSEVTRATGAESNLSSRITQNADAITAEVSNRQSGDNSVLRQLANEISSEVTARNGAIASAIKQLAKSITLTVSNGTDRSTITLTGNDITTQAETIHFTGKIVFASDLSSAGETNINGANITTGKISAARIDVDNLTVKALKTTTHREGSSYFGFEVTSDGYVSAGDGDVVGISDRVVINGRLQATGVTTTGAENSFIRNLYQSAGPTNPYCYSRNAHLVTFSWTGSELEVYVDSTKIGKMTVS